MSSNSMLRFTTTAIAHIFTHFHFLCNTQHEQQTQNSVTLDFDMNHFQNSTKKFKKFVNSTTNFAKPEWTQTALEQNGAIDLLVLIGSSVVIQFVVLFYIFLAILVAAILTTLPCAVFLTSFYCCIKPKPPKVRPVETEWKPQTNDTLLHTLLPRGVESELAQHGQLAAIELGQLTSLTNPAHDSQNIDSIRSVSQYFDMTQHRSFRRRFSDSSDDSDCEKRSLARSIQTYV